MPRIMLKTRLVLQLTSSEKLKALMKANLRPDGIPFDVDPEKFCPGIEAATARVLKTHYWNAIISIDKHGQIRLERVDAFCDDEEHP